MPWLFQDRQLPGWPASSPTRTQQQVYTSKHHQLTDFATAGDINAGRALAGAQTGSSSLPSSPRSPKCVKLLLTHKAVAEASAQGTTTTHLLFGISNRAVQPKACMRRLVRASRGRTLKHSGSFLSKSKKPGSNASLLLGPKLMLWKLLLAKLQLLGLKLMQVCVPGLCGMQMQCKAETSYEASAANL
ncbi:MAG: hypothetical protein FRX49_01818 [Trebouxia sp. A1-2]|nr:MAG: hypothetical protein FRX49_01818 [Trebouxia sp. A1-2]